MLLSKRTVTDPEGRRFEVSVDWTRRPLRLPHAYSDRTGSWRTRALDYVDVPSLDEPHGMAVAVAATVALIVLGLLVWFVVWPLLAIATELAVVATIAIAGVVGRVFFGRPWVIEAVGAGAERRWQVRGMAAARRTIDEIADQLAAGVDPNPGEAEAVGLPAAGATGSSPAIGERASYE